VVTRTADADSDTWILRAIGGSTNYGNGNTPKISIGPIASSSGSVTYKSRGLFSWNSTSVATLLDSLLSVSAASITFTVADEACGTRGAAQKLFLEVLGGGFAEVTKNASGTLLTNCQLYASSNVNGVWPGPSADPSSRVFLSASGLSTGGTLVFDITSIIQARVASGDWSRLGFRLIAANSAGTGYDETTAARTVTVYSSKSAGNEPNLSVTGSTASASTKTMSDSISLLDAISVSVTGGPDISVDGEWGVIPFVLADQERKMTLSGVSIADVYMQAIVKLDKLPESGFAYYRLLARFIDASNYYSLTMLVTPDGSITLKLGKFVAAVETELVSIDSGIDLVPDQRYFHRFYATGTTPTHLYGKIWAEGTAEPDPQIDVQDSEAALQTTGSIGLSSAVGALTNLPLTYYWDEFWAAAL
jgi:hypothetical protein